MTLDRLLSVTDIDIRIIVTEYRPSRVSPQWYILADVAGLSTIIKYDSVTKQIM